MRLLAMVGPGEKRVLDIGCSSGYLARPLVDRGCTVVGIERDPEAALAARDVCEEVIVGDVEELQLPFDHGVVRCRLCAAISSSTCATQRASSLGCGPT